MQISLNKDLRGPLMRSRRHILQHQRIHVIFDSIFDFRRITTALYYADQKVLKADGRSFMRLTTAVWDLCIQLKDGSTLWEKLSNLKWSHPVECAEYDVSQGLMNDPAFNWCFFSRNGSILFCLSGRETRVICNAMKSLGFLSQRMLRRHYS